MSKKGKRKEGGQSIGRRERRIAKMERELDRLAERLPHLDTRAFGRVAAVLRDYPGATLRVLVKRLANEDPAVRGLAARAIAGCDDPKVARRLKAMVFDVVAPDLAKVVANDILARSGQGVEPDVLEMSVPDAEELIAQLPDRTLDILAEGRRAEAVARFRGLAQAEKALLVYRLAESGAEGAAEFYEQVAAGDDYVAEACVWAISMAHMAAGAAFVARMSESSNKGLHKAAKRALYDLRASGVDVPHPEAEVEEKPEPEAEPSDGELPVYQVWISATSDTEPIFLSVARERPNGRLKVISMVIDLWKGGMRSAAFRQDLSKSGLKRAMGNWRREMELRESDLDEARRIVARAILVCRAMETPIPMDFQLGRSLLGLLDDALASAGAPFRCSECGAALDGDMAGRARDAAVYSHVKLETRCAECRARDEGGAEG